MIIKPISTKNYFIKNAVLFLAFALLLGAIVSCEEDPANMLWVDQEHIDFPAEGSSTTFHLKTDAADGWQIENPAPDWITVPITSGTLSDVNIPVKVTSRTLTKRSDSLRITAGNATPVYVVISQSSSEYLYDLLVNIDKADFDFNAATLNMEISTNAPEWNLACNAEWLQLSKTSGEAGDFTISIQVEENNGSDERSSVITLSGADAPSTEIAVTQSGISPSYNTNPIAPDATGMSSTAVELAAKMKIGWNIGNTLEAIGGETAWGNPLVTEELIQLVKQNGFNAIRIPCSWNQHLENSSSLKIKDSWLNRVKEVVGYCVDNDMYVILNIHWDGGWLEENCTTNKQAVNIAKQKALWEQIATHLRDFDEHLLFAGSNEPNVENATQMNVLMSYHQTFVDAVRSTGGKNSYRTLVVQGPYTDIEKTDTLMKTLPTDEVEGRMMAEVHYYTPYQFCMLTEDASWGKMFYYWGSAYHSTTDTERNASWGEESTLQTQFASMKNKFVDKGIPVILGEFAVNKRMNLTGDALQLHLASRLYYLEYLTSQAKLNGIIPFYWDTGYTGEVTSTLFNRNTYSVHDQDGIDALMKGINGNE